MKSVKSINSNTSSHTGKIAVARPVAGGQSGSWRAGVTPQSYVDPDNFREAVRVLWSAREQLLRAADQADFAARKAGTPIRTQTVREKINLLSAEISRIEQQIMRASSTEHSQRDGSGMQDLLRKMASIRTLNHVDVGSHSESFSAMEFGLRNRTRNDRGKADRLHDRYGHASLLQILRDNVARSRGFDQRGLNLALTALRVGPKLPKKPSTTCTSKTPKELAAMTDAQLSELGTDELERLIRQVLNVNNDASMSDAELKLAMRLAAIVDPKNSKLHLAAIAAENINTLRALAEHVGFARDLRDLAKSMSDVQLKALSTKDLTGLIGVPARAGDDHEMTEDDLEQIQRVLSAFNNSERSPASALTLVETAIGVDLLKVLAYASVDLRGGNLNELALGSELRRLVGSASFALNFSTSGLATLIQTGDGEVAGFLFKSGVTYSLEMFNLGFRRFVVNNEGFDDELQNFLIPDPPGLRVLDALGSNPAAASSILFAGKDANQAWVDYKKWLDGPDRLSMRRIWNPEASMWDARYSDDKATDLVAALFLRAATHGYATQHTGPGEGKFLFDILTHAVKEEGKYKLTDGGRVALAALLNDTMVHKDFANGYIVTLATGSSLALPGLRGAELLKFIEVLSGSRRAADEITAGFGGLLTRVDIVDPFQDYRNAQNAGEAFKRVTRSINDGLKARSDEERATAQKYALLATVVVSLATGGLAAGAAAAGAGAGAVVWAGVGDGLMSYISGIPSDTFKALEVNDLVTFQFQRRILESETPGIVELKKDPLVAKYLNENGTVKLPDPRELKKMMDDINNAFYRIDPTNSQHSQYPGPQGVLEKALSGWEKDTNK
jgi:hypothetical protein